MRTRHSLRFWSCWISFALSCLGCATTDQRLAERDRALALDERADRYTAEGDYARAEPLYRQSLAIREKALGPEHPEVAASLSNLAAIYHSKGDYARAKPLYERSLAIREKALRSNR